MKSIMKLRTLQMTTHYGMFEMHPSNRANATADGYAPRSDLLQSMKEHGFWDRFPVICDWIPETGRLLIIDGHNRYVAARHLGIPFFYMAYERGDLTPKTVSTAVKPWTISDFCDAFAKEGNEDFAEVMDFSDRTRIQIGAALSMFFGDTASSTNATRLVKIGKFRIKDREHPWIVADIVRTAGEVCRWGVPLLFVHAVSKAVMAEGFSSSTLKTKILRHPELLTKQRGLDGYLALLETIYNRHSKGEPYRLRIAVEQAMDRRCTLAPIQREIVHDGTARQRSMAAHH